MRNILFGALLLTLSSAFAAGVKKELKAPGCQEFNQPQTQMEFKMCEDAQKKMAAAIKMSKTKDCSGMNTPEYQEEYKSCLKVTRLPASSK